MSMSAGGGQARQVRVRVPRFAEAAVERARLSVVPNRRIRAPRTPFAVLVLAVLAAGVVGLLMFNTHMQQASFRATALEQQAGGLVAQQQSLDMELERLRDPQRLAKKARALGLVAPAVPAFIRLADGAVIGTPTPARAEDAVPIHALPPAKPQNLDPPPIIIEVAARPTGPAKPRNSDDAGSGSAGAGAGTGTNGGQTQTGSTTGSNTGTSQ